MSEKTFKRLVITGVVAVILLIGGTIGAFRFFERIDNGYVGVRFSPNGGVKSEAL